MEGHLKQSSLLKWVELYIQNLDDDEVTELCEEIINLWQDKKHQENVVKDSRLYKHVSNLKKKMEKEGANVISDKGNEYDLFVAFLQKRIIHMFSKQETITVWHKLTNIPKQDRKLIINTDMYSYRGYYNNNCYYVWFLKNKEPVKIDKKDIVNWGYYNDY